MVIKDPLVSLGQLHFTITVFFAHFLPLFCFFFFMCRQIDNVLYIGNYVPCLTYIPQNKKVCVPMPLPTDRTWYRCEIQLYKAPLKKVAFLQCHAQPIFQFNSLLTTQFSIVIKCLFSHIITSKCNPPKQYKMHL